MTPDQKPSISEQWRSWRSRRLSQTSVLFCAAVLIGLSTGVGAWLVKRTIRYISLLATDVLRPDGWNWPFLILPLIGVLLAVVFSRYLARRPLEGGTGQVKKVLASDDYAMSGRLTFDPLVANALTLGLGGSAGAEGPIAFAGAAMGSNIGRLFGLSPRLVRLLVGVGAGAGIAAIFKAPIGGALFTLEVLAMELTTLSIFVLLTGALVGGLTSFTLLGLTPAFDYHTSAEFLRGAWLAPTIALGIVSGFYSIFYNWSERAIKRLCLRVRNVWLRALGAGAVMGGLLFAFPSLYGEGYPAMRRILHGDASALVQDGPFWHLLSNGWSVVIIAAAIILIKGVVTSATNNGGGVGGKFAPTLFAGCVAGLVFGAVANHIPGISIAATDYAFIGMAAVMAGTIRAPFMAVFLTSEMCGNFGLFLPSAVAAFLSYAIARRLAPGLGG